MCRKLCKAVLFLNIATQVATEILRLKCEIYANFSIIKEDAKLNRSFDTLYETDLPSCQYECSKESRCKSISIKKYEDICELHHKSADDARDRISTVPAAGWTFYSTSYKERLVINFD